MIEERRKTDRILLSHDDRIILRQIIRTYKRGYLFIWFLIFLGGGCAAIGAEWPYIKKILSIISE